MLPKIVSKTFWFIDVDGDNPLEKNISIPKITTRL